MVKSMKELDGLARDIAFEICYGADRFDNEDVAAMLSPFSPLSPSEMKAFRERIVYHCPDFAPPAYRQEDFVSSWMDGFLSLVPVQNADHTFIREEFAHLNDVQERGKWFKVHEFLRFRCNQATREFLPNEPPYYYESVEISTAQAARETIDASKEWLINDDHRFDGDLSPYYGDSVVAHIAYDGDTDTYCLTKYAVGEEPKTYKLEELSDEELNRLISVVESVKEVAYQTIWGAKGDNILKFDTPIPVLYEYFDYEKSGMEIRSMAATHIVLSVDGLHQPYLKGKDYSDGCSVDVGIDLDWLSEKSLERVQQAAEEAYKKFLKDYERSRIQTVATLACEDAKRIGSVKL